MVGLRFHEHGPFNEVLLPKMDARILNELEALLVRTIKGLYFPNSDFRLAKMGGRALWGWPLWTVGIYYRNKECGRLRMVRMCEYLKTRG